MIKSAENPSHFYHLSSFSNQACSACLTQIARKACYNSHTYCDIWHATKNERSSVLNLPKQRQVCPSLFFQFNMRISVIYGTLSVSYKRVVSVLSLLASNSCGGSHMITNIPAPDHLYELLGHFSFFFFKDQRKNDVSDFESDTMTSFRTTSNIANQIAGKKSFRKQWSNGLYGIDRTLNSASQPVKKRRALFSSVDSPSQGKRLFVQLVLFFNKCRQWWPGC